MTQESEVSCDERIQETQAQHFRKSFQWSRFNYTRIVYCVHRCARSSYLAVVAAYELLHFDSGSNQNWRGYPDETTVRVGAFAKSFIILEPPTALFIHVRRDFQFMTIDRNLQ